MPGNSDFTDRGYAAADAIHRIVCNDRIRDRWPQLRELLDFVAPWLCEITKTFDRDLNGTQPLESDPHFELTAILRLLLEVMKRAQAFSCEGISPNAMLIWNDLQEVRTLLADISELRDDIHGGMRVLDSSLEALRFALSVRQLELETTPK